MSETAAAPSVLITSSGRSGSNWLLGLFDTAPSTVCRNEPHGIPGSVLHAATWERTPADAAALLDRSWDEEAQRLRRSFWRRDQLPPPEKSHHRWPQLSRAAIRATRVDSIRRVMRGLGIGGEAHRFPRPMIRSAELSRSTLVLKVGPHWWIPEWFLHREEAPPVVHLVRHPGAVLESYLRRHHRHLDASQVEAERTRYITVNERSASDRLVSDPRLPRFSELGLPELMAWHWRLNNRRIADLGEGKPNYQRVRYEDLVAEPLENAEAVLRRAGVEVDDVGRLHAAIGRSVFGDLPTDSSTLIEGWRDRLDDEMEHLVDIALGDEQLRSWW